MKDNPRAVALYAICSVVLTKKSLSNFRFPDAYSQSLTFGTLRFYHQLNDVVTKRLKHSLKKDDLDIHCLMLLGSYQILHTNTANYACIFETVNVVKTLNKTWSKSLVNAILRQVERDQKYLLKQVHYSHPSWLVKKIKHYYPDHFEQIFLENNTQAPMTLRMHPTSSDKIIPCQTTKNNLVKTVAPQARILDKPVRVAEIEGFEKGSCYVQDASAQLAGHLLKPDNTDLILDACCAPGGKTTHLSELAPKANIVALDNHPKRLEKVQENIDRFSIDNINPLCGNAQHRDWWDGRLFDKILLDAPCSATGVIRRHPDIKLLRKPKDIGNLVILQQQILQNLWSMLKPNGVLLYATCSILKNENELQIAQFLQNHREAIEEKITLNWGIPTAIGKQQLPCYHFDGFYYAKLKKLA